MGAFENALSEQTKETVVDLYGEALTELREVKEALGAIKSCEIWGDDEQSWTIDLGSCRGLTTTATRLILAVKRHGVDAEDVIIRGKPSG